MAPKKFSPEFREQAVRAVIDSSRSVADLAREFGVGPQTSRNRVEGFRVADLDLVPGVSESERVEPGRSRQGMRELRREREFLGEGCATNIAGGTGLVVPLSGSSYLGWRPWIRKANAGESLLT